MELTCSQAYYHPKTIRLCVWQAIHLNIPPFGEPSYKQTLRKIKWSFLAMVAPEFVAFNARYGMDCLQLAPGH
jgi:hypothetical protein